MNEQSELKGCIDGMLEAITTRLEKISSDVEHLDSESKEKYISELNRLNVFITSALNKMETK